MMVKITGSMNSASSLRSGRDLNGKFDRLLDKLQEGSKHNPNRIRNAHDRLEDANDKVVKYIEKGRLEHQNRQESTGKKKKKKPCKGRYHGLR
jgi:phage shock protein A